MSRIAGIDKTEAVALASREGWSTSSVSLPGQPRHDAVPDVAMLQVREPQASWLWLGLPMGLALLLYAPVIPALVGEWARIANLSHGFAIPLISVYLIWMRRHHLEGARLTPSLWGLPVLLLGLALLVVGTRGDESFIARISLPVVLMGVALFVAGTRITREIWFGIAYLLFMIPLPWATLKLITYRSRLLDATVAAHGVGWLGVPVFQDGVLLHLPNLTLEVADECSSIPAIAALLSLGVAYASIGSRPLLGRFAIVAAALPFAILSNIIRIVITAAAVYYLGPWTLQTLYHQFTGTVNFLLTLMLLLALDGCLGRLGRSRKAA